MDVESDTKSVKDLTIVQYRQFSQRVDSEERLVFSSYIVLGIYVISPLELSSLSLVSVGLLVFAIYAWNIFRQTAALRRLTRLERILLSMDSKNIDLYMEAISSRYYISPISMALSRADKNIVPLAILIILVLRYVFGNSFDAISVISR